MKIDIAVEGTPPYTSEVFIGEDVMEGIAGRIESALDGRSVYWIWDETVWSLWGRKAHDLGWPPQKDPRVTLFTASESNKRLASVEFSQGSS